MSISLSGQRRGSREVYEYGIHWLGSSHAKGGLRRQRAVKSYKRLARDETNTFDGLQLA